MQVGDRIGNLEVTHITCRQRKDGSQGAPLLVDVRCKCGVEKTVRADVLTAKRPQQSCGGKGCKRRVRRCRSRPNPKRKSGTASGEAQYNRAKVYHEQLV